MHVRTGPSNSPAADAVGGFPDGVAESGPEALEFALHERRCRPVMSLAFLAQLCHPCSTVLLVRKASTPVSSERMMGP